MKRFAAMFLGVLFAVSAGGRAETISFTRTLGPEDFTPEAMRKELREYVDKAIRILSGEEPMLPSYVAGAAALIETQTAAAAYDKEWEGKPREQIARGLLGEERAAALEKACLAALESGDEDVRRLARGLLGESLGSRIREEAWELELREAMEGYKRTGILPISLDECFSLAANLAYLGNPAGKEVLVDVLSSDSHSFFLRQDALKAMKALGELRPDGFLDKLLRSPDARIAYEAFDAVGSGANGCWTTPLVMEAAQAQLVRLGEKYDREGSLSLEEAHLLSTAGFALVVASREGALPDGLAAAAKAAAGDKSPYEMYALFSTVVEQIRAQYVDADKCGYQDLVYSALHGMLQSLDPHSSFMDEEEFSSMKEDTSGKFGGLGITIGMKNSVLTVIAPMEGTPAFRAGLLGGDKIIEIEDESTDGLALDEAVKKLRGDPGTKVKIKVFRPSTHLVKTFTITRAIINVPSVKDVRVTS